MSTELLHHFEIFFGISVLLSFSKWGKRVLFPFQLFTTWVHECGHAVGALVMGGGNIRITLETDGSGVTAFTLPKSRIRQGVVASAGYLGATLVGAILFYLVIHSHSRNFPGAYALTLAICSLLITTIVFWIRNGFGVVCVSVMTAVLGTVAFTSFRSYLPEVLLFLAMQTVLNAFFDLRVLFFSRDKRNDAFQMQKLFYVPAALWALFWGSMSLVFLYWLF